MKSRLKPQVQQNNALILSGRLIQQLFVMGCIGLSLSLSGCQMVVRQAVRSAMRPASSSNSSQVDESGPTTIITSPPNSQASRAVNPRQTRFVEYEGIKYLIILSRAQVAYYKKATPPRFANDLSELEPKQVVTDPNYLYRVDSVGIGYAILSAQAQSPTLRSYTGVVFGQDEGRDRLGATYRVCGTDQPSTTPPVMQGAMDPNNFQCPVGSSLAR